MLIPPRLWLTYSLNNRQGGKLSHAASNVFKIMVFVRFKSSSPTVFKGKRDRVRCFLNGGELSELNALRFELIYVTLGWPFAYSSAREVPILHMLPQCSFRGVVSRELVEDSTHKLVIANLPMREHMTMVHLLV